jgi:hypothetical protein
LATLFTAAGASAQDSPRAKLPEPEQASLVRAEKSIKELFKTDYAKNQPESMRAFAVRLIGQAIETRDDPAARFVLLREAGTLAAQAGEFGIALVALDRIGKEFATDSATLKVTAFKTAAASTSATKQRNLAEAALGIFNEVVAQTNPKAAQDLLSVAESAAAKVASEPLNAKIQSRRAELAEILRAFEAYRAALPTVEVQPDDPNANLIVGKYLAFIRGDWPTGLTHLSKCGDQSLKALATRDLGTPGDPTAQVQLGDDWWDVAEALSPALKRQGALRSAHWYRAASTNLTGLSLTKARERITATDKRYPQRQTLVIRTPLGAYDEIPEPERTKLRHMLTGGVAAYDDIPEPLHSRVVKEYWKYIEDEKICISRETALAKAAKTPKDRKHYEDSVKDREKIIRGLMENNPPWFDPDTLKEHPELGKKR